MAKDDLERVLSAIDKYGAARDALSKKAVYLMLASLLLWGLSRTPLLIYLPFSIVKDPLNRGYVVIFGPFVIYGLFCGFYRALSELLMMRECIFESLGPAHVDGKSCADDNRVQLKPVERFLLNLPFDPAASAEARRAKSLRGKLFTIGRDALLVVIPIFVLPVVCYAVLVAEYLQFRRPRDSPFHGHPTVDLLFGTGGWSPYRPEWGQAPEIKMMPWIYPPWQTWVYLMMGAALCVLVVASLRRMYGIQSCRTPRFACSEPHGEPVPADTPVPD